MKYHFCSARVSLNPDLLSCQSPRIMRFVSVAVVLATMWLCPACAQAFTVFDVSGYGIGRWETDPHFVDGVERSLDGGLRYSVQGGSYEAFRDLFQWAGVTPSVPFFQMAVERAFAAWEVVDPATGLGTDLRFVPDLGTPVVGEIYPDFAADRAHLNRGAEIDLLADDLGSFGGGLANPYYDPIDKTVTLTSGVANYPAAVISGVDIFLHNADPWSSLASFQSTLIHEIGHAIGLGDVDAAEGAAEVLTKFYDDNFDGRSRRTAIATLTNPFAHLIDPLDPDNSPALMLYSLCVPIDPNDPYSCNSDPGLDSPRVDLLMESSGGPSWTGILENDAFAGRQFLYPYVVPEPSTGIMLLIGIATLVQSRRRKKTTSRHDRNQPEQRRRSSSTGKVKRIQSSGFTLVELLVVIAILGTLVALLLPAVQAAREAARSAECKNNLKQFGLASLNFHQTYQFFPLGGTASGALFERYITDGKPNGPLRQGLGWAFQILPYLEQQAAQTNAAAQDRSNGGTRGGSSSRHATEAIQDHSVPSYNCPSRRGPTRKERRFGFSSIESTWLMDYAGAIAGPARSEDRANFDRYLAQPLSERDLLFWGCKECGQAQLTERDLLSAARQPLGHMFRGIIQRCDWDANSRIHLGYTQKISFTQISDGSSNTMLIAEKRLRPSQYDTGSWHDGLGLADGYSNNTIRSTAFPLKPDAEELDDSDAGDELPYSFGSAHPGGMNAVFADGSVHRLNYDTDREVFNQLGHRFDGELLDREQL